MESRRLEPPLGFNSLKNVLITHLENAKKVPSMVAVAAAKAAMISGVIIHIFYNKSIMIKEVRNGNVKQSAS